METSTPPQIISDPAFGIDLLSREGDEVVIRVKRGILGALSNQLIKTHKHYRDTEGQWKARKGATIIRKLGFVLAQCGDYLYDDKLPEPEFMRLEQ